MMLQSATSVLPKVGDAKKMAGPPSRITEYDIFLFRQGTHSRLYEKLGAHLEGFNGENGVSFGVWAPEAASISVIGSWNEWDPKINPLTLRQDGSGIWQTCIPDVNDGALYKYQIRSKIGGKSFDKGDPFAFFWELPPKNASIVRDTGYSWSDNDWMRSRWSRNSLGSPVSIYELHLGSWCRRPGQDFRSLSYREIAHRLAEYVHETGFTHVELLPVMEHPYYPSWGYQTLGYFAPTSRYGTPQDFMYFIDHLHQQGIGVILDWVPSHFPDDPYGLRLYDGTALYEHYDDRQGYHPEWTSRIFNYGRHEVRAFLISSALFWLDVYHADGIRVDAVASMLYHDYARDTGDWVPNRYGGRENLGAIEFLRRLNESAYTAHPDILMIAEESTAWPMVTKPPSTGGLGFGLKWNMGWMHDTLSYFSKDPVHRKYHHNLLTFPIWYALSENFLLPLSHDEVVHGKGSLLRKMPGDDWQKYANVRALFGYLFTHPGKKLIFMGGEFGQWNEWYHETSLDWDLLHNPYHRGIHSWIRDLNRLYITTPSLYRYDFSRDGFSWIDCNDHEQGVISYLRTGNETDRPVLVVINLTPVPRTGYRVGVPGPGFLREVLNSDAEVYGGSNLGNFGGVSAENYPFHGRNWSVELTLPPLSTLLLAPEEP